MFLLIPAVPTVDEHFLRIKTDSHILDRAVHPHLFLAEPDLDQNFFSMRIQLLLKCGSGPSFNFFLFLLPYNEFTVVKKYKSK